MKIVDEPVVPLVSLDGRHLPRPHTETTDVVIVGSGPAGATVARACARAGLQVTVVEEGLEARPERFGASGLQAMAAWYRDLGTSVALGRNVVPFLQGQAVGGTSVINGAIQWSLPRDIWDGWVNDEPALGQAIPWARYQEAEALIAGRMGVAPTDDAIAGEKNLLLARGAEALGLAHRPIQRNVERCNGSGRCLQGCPTGRKQSVDRNFLRDAVDAGARVLAGVSAKRVVRERGRAVAVQGRAASGQPVTVRARHAVVLAASAIQTPLLLCHSGLTRGPVGRGLMAHPGVSVTGRFDHDVDNHRGATQGHEVTGLRGEGIKFEALGFDLSILASRVPGVGRAFAARMTELRRHAVWGAALRAQAQGRVSRGPWGFGRRALVRYALTPDDVLKARRATRVLCDLFLAAGATEVYPGVAGVPTVVRTHDEAARIEEHGPLDARAYAMSMTHLFATARMGRDPARSVVGLDFQHHDVRGLYVADSSVFPSNTGVNPQLAIMALAHLAAAAIVGA